MKFHLIIAFLVLSLTSAAQNAIIQTKTPIELSELPIWKNITDNGEFKPGFEHMKNIDFYFISYLSDSILINGIIATPKSEGKFPVIIFNRGGNQLVGQKSKMQTLNATIFATSHLVNEGYVVMASCYREADEFGGKDLNDVLVLLDAANEVEKADPERIGMFGWSRGGMMTYLALRQSERIKTAVIGNGPTDLFALIEDRPEMETMVYVKLIPNYSMDKEAALKSRSVIHWATELNKSSSLLILCGTEDERVNPNQAENLANILKEINYNFELKKFETDHSFSGKQPELQAALRDWFKNKL